MDFSCPSTMGVNSFSMNSLVRLLFLAVFVASSAHWALQDRMKSPYLVYSELTIPGKLTFDIFLSLSYIQSLGFVCSNKKYTKLQVNLFLACALCSRHTSSFLKWTRPWTSSVTLVEKDFCVKDRQRQLMWCGSMSKLDPYSSHWH